MTSIVIQWFWIANFNLKYSTFLIVDSEMEYNQKSSASRKIILSGKFNAKMTPPRMFRVFRTAKYYIGKYFLMVKMAFLSMPNICFCQCTYFLELYFFCQFPGNFFDSDNILITMKQDVVLT